MIKEEEKKLRLMPLYFARREVVCEPSNTQAQALTAVVSNKSPNGKFGRRLVGTTLMS